MQETDAGYLLDFQEWTAAWALQKAASQHRELADFDWQVIQFARDFYAEHQIMPLTRRLIKFIRAQLQPDFDSLLLQAYYTDKPLRVIALLAGLPRPIQCI